MILCIIQLFIQYATSRTQHISITTYYQLRLWLQKACPKETIIKIADILSERSLDETIVENRIKTIVKKSAEDAKSMQNTGYNVYERDVESDIYEIEKINNFIQGPDGELYIIFAYGNSAFTSEMDIIQI